METALISQACHVRKPTKPKRGCLKKFPQIWELLERKVCEYHVTKHQTLIEDVCQYISRGTEGSDILTATLRLGSNVSDHSGIFVELASQLCETTQMICRLAPIDCTSLSSITNKIFNDFIDSLCIEDAPKLKKSLVTFENIVEIFKLVTKQQKKNYQRSPQKRKSTIPSVHGNKLIIIIEDVTSIKPAILEDLSLIIKGHLDCMETCFVFGISSTAQSIQKILSFKCASCLAIKTFTSPPVSETLSGIFDLLVLNRDFPFRLSPELFYWLSGFVLDHDFSLNTLLQILRVALTLHLNGIEKRVLKALFIKGRDEIVDAAVQEHYEAHLKLEETASAIVALAKCKGIVFKDCYLALQQDDFLSSDIFRRLENVVKFLSTDELLQRLQSYVEEVEEGDIADEFVNFCGRLLQDDIDENLAEEGDTDLTTVKSRFDLMDRMRLAAQKKRTTKLDLVREDVIKYMKEKANKLYKPQDLSFYSEIYIGNAKKLAALFTPSLRSRVNQALAVPASVLECSCCRVKPTDMSMDLPPISVAYKLHLECGKMINIYDWLQSYQAVKEDTSDVALAQFLRATRELQVLGYVKPTTRKTDHVQRLTWGSC